MTYKLDPCLFTIFYGLDSFVAGNQVNLPRRLGFEDPSKICYSDFAFFLISDIEYPKSSPEICKQLKTICHFKATLKRKFGQDSRSVDVKGWIDYWRVGITFGKGDYLRYPVSFCVVTELEDE